MNHKKQYQFPSFWATVICILSFCFFYQIYNADKFPLSQSNSEAIAITELQVLPVLIPGQVEGTFQHIVIRNLPKTTLQKATIFPSLKDSYFSELVLKTSLSSRPGNYFCKIFYSSIFSNAP